MPSRRSSATAILIDGFARCLVDDRQTGTCGTRWTICCRSASSDSPGYPLAGARHAGVWICGARRFPRPGPGARWRIRDTGDAQPPRGRLRLDRREMRGGYGLHLASGSIIFAPPRMGEVSAAAARRDMSDMSHCRHGISRFNCAVNVARRVRAIRSVSASPCATTLSRCLYEA
jgi:hypothetical protein